MLDLLHSHPPDTPEQAAAVIRAASLIGGDAAIPLIRDAARHAPPYRKGQRHRVDPVRREALRAWPEFPTRDYARSVLTPLIDALAVNDISLLPALSELHGLTRLSITAAAIPTLTFTRSLPNLQWLSLTVATTDVNLEPLDGHPGLTNLQITGVEAPDLQTLSAIPNLTHLTIRRSRQLRHSETLTVCRHLTSVSIGNTPLQNLTDLRLPAGIVDLHLPSITHLTTLAPLSGLGELPALTYLDLSDNPWLTDLADIGNWPALRTLNLTGCASITDLTPLAELPKLKQIHLNWIKKVDLSALRSHADVTVYIDVGQDVEGAPESCRIIRTQDIRTFRDGTTQRLVRR